MNTSGSQKKRVMIRRFAYKSGSEITTPHNKSLNSSNNYYTTSNQAFKRFKKELQSMSDQKSNVDS